MTSSPTTETGPPTHRAPRRLRTDVDLRRLGRRFAAFAGHLLLWVGLLALAHLLGLETRGELRWFGFALVVLAVLSLALPELFRPRSVGRRKKAGA